MKNLFREAKERYLGWDMKKTDTATTHADTQPKMCEWLMHACICACSYACAYLGM